MVMAPQQGHSLDPVAPVEPEPAAVGSLTGGEVASVAAVITAAYGGLLVAMHLWARQPTLDASGSLHPGYWGTLPSAWDHPEPNYIVSGVIGEFWSVLTTIPVAGALLMYEGLKYRYGGKVLCIYALTCGMYSLAFWAHLTLQKVVFSSTVVAVMSNALLTFAEFSWVVHRWLQSKVLRGSVVIVAEVVLVSTVATLPYALEAHGGVWTLFTVQTPGVLLATCLGLVLAWSATDPIERVVFRTVCIAGSLLSTAMGLSLIECLIGFEHGILNNCWGFPFIHIAIHILEQVGIYIFGVGVAALQTLLLEPGSRKGAEVRYVGQWMVYLYCPHPPPELSDLSTSHLRSDHAEPSAKTLAAGAQPVGADERGRMLSAPTPTQAAAVQTGMAPKPGPSLAARRRVHSPAVVARKQ